MAKRKLTPKRTPRKHKPRRAPMPRLDDAQQALANVEKIIGGKLADGMKLEAIRQTLQARHGLKLSLGGLHGILAG